MEGLPFAVIVILGIVQGVLLPFQEFDWSVVLKVGVTIWFVR